MTERYWLFDSTKLPYVVCGALGVLLGEYAYERALGPWFMHEYGLGALYTFGTPLRILNDVVAAIALTNVYHIVHHIVAGRK